MPHGEAGLSAVTLFLDPLSALGPGTQRLLLMLAHRLQRLDGAAPPAGPRRIMAGDRFPLARGAKAHVTCAALVDHFDKIRIELNAPGRRGVA
ncbi:MAG: hypothetical protein HZA61_17210 [Candidatus Eisenbacteria bacterium]|uniref:Uncharacterized protein n=1 Tax=Eiseniibacteriota bacterium TaxID=2212470 RepID=A0A933SF14_UNCEI|nr:hypothetical protein [Candidatus Eisenbacteria bacterium]